MFKKLFKNKKESNDISIYSPIDGELIQIEEVPDPVFSTKMMGDGVAFRPVNGTVVSPVDGEIIQVFPTKHAIGIRTNNGAEILIHIGLDTVNLEGEGFTVYVEDGDSVNRGDKLVTFDKDIIQEKASSLITPVIITNAKELKEIQKLEKSNVIAGEDEILIIKS